MSRIINRIVVHCSATPEGTPFNAADIDRWHRDRGWNGIGYHAVVLLYGTVESGRDESLAGAHVRGHNKDSLSVVYIGGVAADGRTAKDTRTALQRVALRRVVLGWMLKYRISASRVYGHYELDGGKACPSFDMDEFRQSLVDGGGARVVSPEDLPVIGGGSVSTHVKQLQRMVGADVDGWMGPQTYLALAAALGSQAPDARWMPY